MAVGSARVEPNKPGVAAAAICGVAIAGKGDALGGRRPLWVAIGVEVAGAALPNNDGVADFCPRSPPANAGLPSGGDAFVELELAADVFGVSDVPNMFVVVDCLAG